MFKNLRKIQNWLEKNENIYLLIIFVVSILIRFTYLLLRDQYNIYEGDEGFFGQIANNLIQGLGYTHRGHFYTTRMPLLTLITAGYSWLFGYSVFKVHILGVILGSFIPVAAYYLAKAVSNNRLSALLASLYCCVYPFYVHEAAYLDTENLFIPLFLIYVLNLIKLENGPQLLKGYIVSGVLLGILLLTRPTLSIFLPFYALYLLLRKWPIQKIFLNCFIQGIIALLLIAPWSFTLSKAVGHLELFTYGTNSAMLGGTNEIVLNDKKLAGSWVNLSRDYPQELERLDRVLLQEGNGSPSEVAMVQKVIRDNWPRIPWLMCKKLQVLWGFVPKHPDNNTWKDTLVGLFSYGLLLPLFFLAFFKTKILGRELFLLLAIYFSIMTLVTSGTMRFRLPLDAIIIIYAFDYLRVLCLTNKKEHLK